MATIGLDRLYYAKITEGENGDETYATPVSLAKAMTAELSVELAEATLYADDGAAEIVKEFQSGTLSLGVDDIGGIAAEDLTGAKIDDNKVLISASEDGGTPVAIGFRAKKANGKYRYFCCTGLNSAFRRPTSPPRARALPSPRLPSRVRYYAAINSMAKATTRGKRKLARMIPALRQPL
jgi:phi13 family phage major tail protein